MVAYWKGFLSQRGIPCIEPDVINVVEDEAAMKDMEKLGHETFPSGFVNVPDLLVWHQAGHPERSLGNKYPINGGNQDG